MNRIQLKVALVELSERQNQENRLNADNNLAIQKKRDEIVRNADDTMRVEKMQENIRHKEAISDIEMERQQIFADYKMGKAENK